MSSDNDEQPSMAKLFADVKPAASDKLHLQSPPATPRAAFTRADEREVLAESLSDGQHAQETGDELGYRSPTVPPDAYKRLRRGKFAIQDEIDLHGLNAKEAREYLGEFIAESRLRGLRCVRVIHGKGKRSGQRGPVLKYKVDNWLRRWSQVLAYCSARPVDGGTGAVYVLLRKS